MGVWMQTPGLCCESGTSTISATAELTPVEVINVEFHSIKRNVFPEHNPGRDYIALNYAYENN